MAMEGVPGENKRLIGCCTRSHFGTQAQGVTPATPPPWYESEMRLRVVIYRRG